MDVRDTRSGKFQLRPDATGRHGRTSGFRDVEAGGSNPLTPTNSRSARCSPLHRLPWSMLRSLLFRMLFVRAPGSGTQPLAGTDHGVVLTGLVSHRSGWRASSRALADANIVATAAAAQRESWDLDSIRTLRGRLRWFAGILRFTRTRPIVRLLCWLSSSPTPPEYRLSLSPEYDAAVELRFSTPPSAEVVRDVIASAPQGIDWIASREQVLVYDEAGPGDTSIFVCFLIHRPEAITRQECQTYWKTEHAQLVLRNMEYLKLTQYLQVHTAAEPPPGCVDTYDGIVYARKPSTWAVIRQLLHINEFRFNDTLVVDETHFTSKTPVMLMQPDRTW